MRNASPGDDPAPVPAGAEETTRAEDPGESGPQRSSPFGETKPRRPASSRPGKALWRTQGGAQGLHVAKKPGPSGQRRSVRAAVRRGPAIVHGLGDGIDGDGDLIRSLSLNAAEQVDCLPRPSQQKKGEPRRAQRAQREAEFRETSTWVDSIFLVILVILAVEIFILAGCPSRRCLDSPWRARPLSPCQPHRDREEPEMTGTSASPLASDLKITGVEAIYLRLPQVKSQCDSGQDALIVKVTTNAGITGYGEVDSNPLAVKGCIEGPFSHTATTGLAQVILGEDPLRTEYLWHKMYRANIYSGRRGIAIHAMSGIDLALWDIKGKALGPAGLEAAGGWVHPVAAALRKLALRGHSGRDGRASPAVCRPGVHGRQVRLGPDGEGREDRRGAGSRGPERPGPRP